MRLLKRLFARQRMVKKPSLFLSAISLLFVLLFTACTHSNSATDNSLPTEFRIGYQTIPNAELLAKNLQLVENQFPDVSVKWIPFSSGRSAVLAIANGKVDVGLAGSVPAANAIAQGLPVQVYFIHNIIGDNEALAVTKPSKIQSIEELIGKKIAVPFGSTTHFSLLSALAKSNISPESVSIIDMQPAEILTAWKRNNIDGSFVWQPVLNKLIQANGNVLLTARNLAEQGIVTADLGLVSQQFAASYPSFLASYVSVLDSAVQQYREDPKEAASAIAQSISLSPEKSVSVMQELIWLDAKEQQTAAYIGTPDAPGELGQILKSSAEFMVEQNAIPAAPELETFQAALFSQAIEQAAEKTLVRLSANEGT